ncbi:MAG TPA: tRNA (N6-isopentenyl adenosine(37)-C2)-methylthiotransferase MiaB [Alphaproteobacteria bacterium]|nr:tRNA (N6-isopentenyl adenosine(37)-C2)-methylthiotransferase MiaB [Alphaproteobacteria bacterium]
MDGLAHAPKIPGEKKLHILTWGCQMNEYDSNRMADLLAPLGYNLCAEPADADLVILNTCHIREKATEKVFSELGRLRQAQKTRASDGKNMMIAVAGCVAQAEGAEIQTRAPYVDLVFGPQVYHRLPEMIARATREKGGVVDTDFPPESKFDHLPGEHKAPGASAFLSVQEGCDKFCTFCVVPYTRGAEVSRPAASILEEARRLLAGGAKEIVLLGQNVNAWHGDGLDGKTWGLGRLFLQLAELPELLRLRYTTSHPRDMDDELIKAHGAIPQLMPFLHLPVQSGADRVLKAMNRNHTGDDYRRIIEKLRAAKPGMAFSSDFITGFPGETDQDFEDTLQLVRDVNFAQAFSFKYSPRPGTPASQMTAQVPEEVKAARLEALQKLLFEQQLAFNLPFLNQTAPVLFDSVARRPGWVHGRTPFMQTVLAPGGAELVGKVLPVTINKTGQNNMEGTACLSN